MPVASLFLLALSACSAPSEPAATSLSAPQSSAPKAAPKARTLTLAAYTTPSEAYGKGILPAFAKHWKEKTGEDVTFQDSYQGSGAQARAVKEGLEADVVALSLDPDIQVLEDAGLITHPWRTGIIVPA